MIQYRAKNPTNINSSTGFNSSNIYFEGAPDRRRVPRTEKIGRINRKYFEERMRERNLSLRKLAAMLGIGHSQLSLAFSGGRKITLNEAAQMSQIFGVPIHTIIENLGVFIQPVGARRAKVVGVVHGDGLVVTLGSLAADKVTAPDHLPNRAVAVQLRTAGTKLGWLDGSIMFCSEPEGVAAEAVSRLCLVKVQGGPIALAHVARGYHPGTYNLAGMFDLNDAILEWATPVLFTKHP